MRRVAEILIAAGVVLLLGASTTVVMLITRRWVVRTFGEAMSLVLVVTFMTVGGVLLAATGLVWRWGQRRARPGSGVQARALAFVLVGLAGAGAWYLAGREVQALSTKLEWGRFHIGRPVTLRDLTEVGRITTLRFPERATLIDAEFLGGPKQRLIARVEVPRDSVSAFLIDNHIQPWRHGDRALKTWDFQHWGPKTPSGWVPDAARHFVSGEATGLKGYYPWYCPILIDLDSPSVAVIYLYYGYG